MIDLLRPHSHEMRSEEKYKVLGERSLSWKIHALFVRGASSRAQAKSFTMYTSQRFIPSKLPISWV